MSSELYTKLRRLDRGIAAAYKSAVGSSYRGSISKREARVIFNKAVDNERISTKEAKALVLIIDDARFGTDAKEYLIKKLKTSAAKEALRDGSGKLLLASSELAKLNNALKQFTNKINFKSPGSNIRYTPRDYSVIKYLINEHWLFVYELKDSGLHKRTKTGKGVYFSSSDELYLVAGLGSKSYASMTVHEVTHAIQDWRDIRSKVKYIEADAYVAQAVANHTMGRSISEGNKPWQVAYHGAGKMVYENRDGSRNQAWKDAYQDLVQAVEGHGLYSHKHNKRRNYRENSPVVDERKVYRIILRKLTRRR